MGIATLILRRIILLGMRKRCFTQNDTNTSVILVWDYLSKLVKLSKRDISLTGIREIALKARFSQHRLSEDERTKVVEYTKRHTDEIYEQRGMLSRLYIKYILGL